MTPTGRKVMHFTWVEYISSRDSSGGQTADDLPNEGRS